MEKMNRIKLFERLMKMDGIIVEAIQMVANHLYDVNGDLKEFSEKVDVAGSSAEGCMLPRFFYPCEDFEDKINFEFETDMDLVLNFSDEELEGFEINDIKGKPGYVTIEANGNTDSITKKLKSCLQNALDFEGLSDRREKLQYYKANTFDEIFCSTKNAKCFIDSIKLKDVLEEFADGTRAVESLHETLEEVSEAAEKKLQLLTTVQSIAEGVKLFGSFSGSFSVIANGVGKLVSDFTTPILEALTVLKDINIADPRTNHEQTKSSMETTLDIKLKEKLLGRFSYDTVIVMKGKKWSDYTKDQVESFERRWTEMGVLKGLNTEAYLLLTKSHRDDSCAIRVSFTQIEKSLCQQRSTNEKLVYFIFKSMFYKHIKVLNKPGDSTISSFLGKNVMFWVLHDNTDSFSVHVSQKNIVEALKILFGRLNAMITSGDAPYYLMTTINIVDTMPREVKHKLEQRINEILANIEDYIPSVPDIEVVTEKLQKLGQLSKTFAQLLQIQGALSDKLGERTNIETFLSNGMVQNILGKIADVN